MPAYNMICILNGAKDMDNYLPHGHVWAYRKIPMPNNDWFNKDWFNKELHSQSLKRPRRNVKKCNPKRSLTM